VKRENACPCCDGTGVEIDQVAISIKRRAARKSRKLPLIEVSARMGITVSELSRMERGERPWTPQRIARHEQICGK